MAHMPHRYSFYDDDAPSEGGASIKVQTQMVDALYIHSRAWAADW